MNKRYEAYNGVEIRFYCVKHHKVSILIRTSDRCASEGRGFHSRQDRDYGERRGRGG